MHEFFETNDTICLMPVFVEVDPTLARVGRPLIGRLRHGRLAVWEASPHGGLLCERLQHGRLRGGTVCEATMWEATMREATVWHMANYGGRTQPH